MDDDAERIANRETMDALAKHGDDPRIAREIKHWAFFPSTNARASFKSAILAREYQIDDEYEMEDPEIPFVICFAKVQPTTEAALNESTLELNALAEDNSGEYDGWETQVTTQ